MARDRKTAPFAKVLFQASLENGRISPSRVGEVLAYLESKAPRRHLALLKEYHRLVAREISRGRARVEAPQPVGDAVLGAIAATLGRKYNRPIEAEFQPNPALIAGLRVRVGDDVYESSVAGQLQSLAATH